MKKVFRLILCIIFGVIGVNCDDVFEENISDDVVTIISPKDDAIIEGNSVSFLWNSIDGADDYNIEVIRIATSEIIIDSVISNSSFTIAMESGFYEWRVRGENFAYNSSFSFAERFSVASTNDLSSQNVFLNSPSQDFFTKNNTIIVSWSNLEAAESYNIQVEKTIDNNTSIIFQDDSISETNYTLDSSILSEDAIYQWSIQAANENSETVFSSRIFSLDTMTPNQPTLISPNDDTQVSTVIDFSWEIGVDSGNVQSSINSLLEISADEDFSSILQSYLTDDTTQEHTFTTTGDFYWRVKSIDKAGNESLNSETRLISVE
jgi:hypothetical protein